MRQEKLKRTNTRIHRLENELYETRTDLCARMGRSERPTRRVEELGSVQKAQLRVSVIPIRI